MNAFTLDAAGAAYREKRETLRQAEIALKEQHERVAEMRRALPTETPVPEDYAFTEAGANGSRKVRLSALFGDDHYRGMDSYSPVWSLLDLLPAGRGEWMPGLAYD